MLHHLPLDPQLCEPFKKMMVQQGWEITHQDVGQTELVGYGYVIIWQKQAHKVVMHYADRQGIATANLEISKGALPDIQLLLSQLSNSNL